jgi:uncharacterized protein YjbI with pentapeptide repeats
MNLKFLVPTSSIIALTLTAPAMAENLADLSKLLSTRSCQQCDLNNAGLAMANLTGADLRGANLVNANLSQANLSGADLSGANLTGASLYGANLQGANLSAAIVNNTDLRLSYLYNANFTGTNLNTSYLQGATGIPANAATAEQFYTWGVYEIQNRNYKLGMEHFNQSLNINPEFAPAYLARALAYYRLGNESAATADAEKAAALFQAQGDASGYQTTQSFMANMEAVREAIEKNRKGNNGGGNFGNVVRTVGSLLLRFLMP